MQYFSLQQTYPFHRTGQHNVLDICSQQSLILACRRHHSCTGSPCKDLPCTVSHGTSLMLNSEASLPSYRWCISEIINIFNLISNIRKGTSEIEHHCLIHVWCFSLADDIPVNYGKCKIYSKFKTQNHISHIIFNIHTL